MSVDLTKCPIHGTPLHLEKSITAKGCSILICDKCHALRVVNRCINIKTAEA